MADRVERVVEVERRPEPVPVATGGGGGTAILAIVVAVVLLIGLGYIVIRPGSDGASVNVSAPKIEAPKS